MKKTCGKCHDYGRYQAYIGGRVVSRYCGCPAGRHWVEKIKKEFLSRGLDVSSPYYPWNLDSED